MSRKHTSLLLLSLALFIAAVGRFWQLGNIPISMSDDEVRLSYSAYSIARTGKDLAGRVLPLAFPQGGYAFNPIPIYMVSPVVGILGLTIVYSRILFAIAGVATVFLVYRIAYQLLKDNVSALLSLGVMALSAWHLQISRFAYEGGIALFFYVLGVSIFLHVQRNSFIRLAVSLFFFFLGFYSYSGFKLTLIPILAILVWYKRRELPVKHILLTLCFVLLTYVSFFYVGKTQQAFQYGGSLFFFTDMQSVARDIELERRASSAPEILKRAYHNKLTYLWKGFISRYQYAFSPQYLFTGQEASGIFSLWSRGQMYYHEAILLLLGMLYLFVRRKRELTLLFLFLLAGALPSGLGPEPTTYTIRASFMLPWLAILAGSGIRALGYFIENKKLRRFTFGVVAVLYMYSVGGYITQYYFEWMRYGAKYYSKADYDLAQFMNKEKAGRTKVVVDGVYPMTFLHWAFYSQLAPSIVQGKFNQYIIDVDHVTFRNTCIDFSKQALLDQIPINSLYIMSPQCINDNRQWVNTHKPSRIIRSLDELDEWYVYKT